MAIDPARLDRQRAAIQSVKDGEYECPGCGRRTRDREGRCASCRRVGGAIDRARLSVEQIRRLQTACKSELQRRRDALDAALRETA